MRWSCRSTLFTAATLCGLLVVAFAEPVFAADAGVTVHAAGTSAGDADSANGSESLSPRELEALVGPVALYPDDLLAIVLPASTYPLQIVQAARYLEALEQDPSLEPDGDWDESVVALLNYPEVVEKLNEDLEWTADLGQAVLRQEQALLDAVDSFRRRAYAAGNLPSDRRQRVEVDESAIRIRPADPAVIYVPYYEPTSMHVRHAYPVYHYYSRPCPVYYYPYPAGHYLASRHFWGMTSAFSIGWHSRNLHFHLLEHRSHPYYGHQYAFRHYRYWRPRLMDVHRHDGSVRRDRDRHTSRWQPGYRVRDDGPRLRFRGDDAPFGRPSAGRILDRLQRDDGHATARERLLRSREQRQAAGTPARADPPARSLRRSDSVERARVERHVRDRSPLGEARSGETVRSLRRAGSPERERSRAADRATQAEMRSRAAARGRAEARSESRTNASSANRGARFKYRPH